MGLPLVDRGNPGGGGIGLPLGDRGCPGEAGGEDGPADGVGAGGAGVGEVGAVGAAGRDGADDAGGWAGEPEVGAAGDGLVGAAERDVTGGGGGGGGDATAGGAWGEPGPGSVPERSDDGAGGAGGAAWGAADAAAGRAPRSGCSLAGRLVTSRWAGSAVRVGAGAPSPSGRASLGTLPTVGMPLPLRSGPEPALRSATEPALRSGTEPAVAAARPPALTGSLGCTSRLRPSRSALRRTRSAWASSMLDEWLFTPIPSDRASSSVSLLVSPSSRASS